MRALPDGYEVALHRALTEEILLAGAPRALAIMVGTLSAAVGIGLQLWIVGGAFWLLGHSLAVLGARRDPRFMSVMVRHLRHKPYLEV
ncbi:VirB3 family type IV secretion system protein [Paremcibacter congregatus]|uniref:VirB3 family type IV secretion system protein n=1 Tax=Paremcibacter congregatus TaxID=2043170 RepID=UPI003A8E8033